ncbi:26S proteasome non-ATPase regulatory subunit 10 [Geosmithia morbida]|uniref:26S proteasome non-ATPase regulatory subunit 10 n=1 Tax=Geosmithia morbida TaxID=1094350 RepID=A0A9P5D515_9HYPO|nr:26S proteasome non-ATPase regulatory subunit 10 [Geosmithia morbida]KAF4123320.1 26S proteasome non-ATPase regulatory subunit 10 [Geosmithia morbida]
MDKETDRFPLHTAARLGQVSVAEGLLKTDPKLSKRKDDDDRYPIHWAASSNSLDIVNLLADQKGFDPDVQVTSINAHCARSLSLSHHIVVDRSSISLQDGSGWTPLMIAASVPDSEPVLKLLLQRGADPIAQIPWLMISQSALHFVASKKDLDTARLLIENKASTRVRNKRGQYAIHRAAAVGSQPLVSLLLRNRSPIDATDADGYTPLHHAIAEGHGDVAILLLKEGADHTLKTSEDQLAIDLAPDKDVRRYIIQGAEREGIDLSE